MLIPETTKKVLAMLDRLVEIQDRKALVDEDKVIRLDNRSWDSLARHARSIDDMHGKAKIDKQTGNFVVTRMDYRGYHILRGSE